MSDGSGDETEAELDDAGADEDDEGTVFDATDPESRRHERDREAEPAADELDEERRRAADASPGDEFTADAETQGRTEPSVNADVHDPRRGEGDEPANLAESALGDDSGGAAEAPDEEEDPSRSDESEDERESRDDRPEDDESEREA